MADHKTRLSIKPDRKRALKYLYGLTPEAYTALLESQNYTCKICQKPQDWVTNKSKLGFWSLCVDHDHVTGRIRGLLCSKCNTLLGKAEDKVEVLQRAIEYLNNTL